MGWLPRSHRHLYLLGAIRLMGSTTAEGGGGWIVGSPVAGGMGSSPHCHCCQVTCGSGAAVIRLESHTATSPVAARFSGAVESAATVRGRGLKVLTLQVPRFHFYLFPSPSFICMDVWSYPASYCVDRGTFVDL